MYIVYSIFGALSHFPTCIAPFSALGPSPGPRQMLITIHTLYILNKEEKHNWQGRGTTQ